MAMMTWMRRTSKFFLIAVIVAFLASLAYFGATQDRASPEWVAKVDGDSISAGAYQRAYRAAVEQYRQAFKERFSEELLRSLRLQDQVLERLITEHLLRRQAEREGIRVSDDELSREITRIPAFQEAGRFSRDRYLQLLARAQLTAPAFEEDFRGDLLRQRLQGLVSAAAQVSPTELRHRWEVERSRVRLLYLAVAAEPAGDGPAVSDAELEAYHKAHAAEFTQAERRRVLVALVPSASVHIPVISDADVEAAYKARRAEFEQPGRARLSHILVRVPTVGGSAAEDGARAKAEAALQRIRGGADFALVAREVSEDTANAARGGDLGLVGPGELVPEFDKVVFGLKRGELAGPIRTPFGYHVVKVVDVVPAQKRELKDVATTLRATLAAEGHLRALRDAAQAAQQALLAAPDFAAEARKRGLALRETGLLRRGDPVEGIGRVAEVAEAIFGLPPDGVSSAVKVPEGYAVFRLLERQPARALGLAEARDEVTRAVRRQKAQEAAQARARELVDALRAGQDPRGLARDKGAIFGEAGPFSRAEPLADRELGQAIGAAALALPEGGVGGPVSGPRGFYALKVVGRERPDPAEFERTRQELESRTIQEKRSQLWQAWLGSLRAAATVEVNRRLLPEG